MSAKIEETEQLQRSAPDATTASSSTPLPAYLCSPTPELTGSKLVRYKLRQAFIRRLSYRAYSVVSRGMNVVKRGAQVRLQEALAMEFIAQNTTIPVARVLDVFLHEGVMHLVQERIHGPVLADVWSQLSPEKKRSCVIQIKDYLEQLHALKPPHPERVQAIDGSSLLDSRVWDEPWGPFENHDEFHRFLQFDHFRQHPDRYPSTREPLAKVAGKKYRTVFSHGDFGPHNMILSHGKVFIIDWEMAGWFPEYWDYARAYAARGHFKIWWDMFKEVVDRYDDETEVMMEIASYNVGYFV